MTVADRYRRLLKRRAPDTDRAILKFAESYEAEKGEATKYLLGAMRPVGKVYTDRMVEQGNRVENQLTARLKPFYSSLDYRRQGSVSNQTHIRYYSDVDVLAIIDKFVILEPPQEPVYPYAGDVNHDLLVLRAHCARELADAFPKATVDNSGTTCVVAKDGSLECPVDVVPSTWYNTLAYASTGNEESRGIMVYNTKKAARVTNYPFLFNARLNTHDLGRSGVPRMLIRLLKSIKADREEETTTEIALSSFDICSLVYRMPDGYFADADLLQPLSLIRSLLQWMKVVGENKAVRDSLKVVDDSRSIFDDEKKVAGLGTLYSDLQLIYDVAVAENSSSYRIVSKGHMAA